MRPTQPCRLTEPPLNRIHQAAPDCQTGVAHRTRPLQDEVNKESHDTLITPCQSPVPIHSQ